jgi:hypothetical protein
MAASVRIRIPADGRWHHVASATVLAAVKALELSLARLGDLSLLLNQALVDLIQLGGVERLVISVEAAPKSVEVSIVGEGSDIERPNTGSSWADPVTGSVLEWTDTGIVGRLVVTG